MTMGLVHAARQIEAQGRGPDTSLAHISPDESAMLDYMQGGRRMNPVTGLPEYSLFGKILKAVAKIGASTVGFMYGGPLGAAAASAAVSKLTGDSWKSALTTGAISGLTSGIGSYASGVGKGASGLSKLGEIATTSGNTIAANAANAAATGVAKTAATEASKVAVGATPGFYSGLQNAGSMASLAPATISSMPSSVAASIPGALGSGISSSVPGILTGAALPATGLSALGSNIMNAGYGVLGAGLGAGISTKGTPATPLPAPYQAPYDPKNVFSWMRRPSQQQIAVSPMNTYQNYAPEMQTYADGGDVGMGLPQSAAMPQLMSAAQFGYLNARTGGRIAGPGDGKSDDIPALLSNGEHVIDAATVSDLGNGDNDTGQKRLEVIKHKIRSNAGRKNPRKASPKQKGLGSLLKGAVGRRR
jgi:hypothetical protein